MTGMEGTNCMKRMTTAFAALLACALFLPSLVEGAGITDRVADLLRGNKTLTVGADIQSGDITDFYYTFSSSTFPPQYQRYRFYAENGTHRFFHEKREGDHWPLLESDATDSGTKVLNAEEWKAFFRSIEGGTVKNREEHLESGDSGPWMYLYRNGGPKEGQEFYFATLGARNAFLDLCARLKENAPKQ